MRISELVARDAVLFESNVISKKRLFQVVGEAAHAAYGLAAAEAFEGLQEREMLGPTGVGNGVALPHTRVAGADRVVGVFVRLDKPIDFGSVDRLPVDLVLTLFAPEDSGVEHLKALASVSRLLRDPGLCRKLRANDDPAVLFALLTEHPLDKAA